MEIRFEKVNFQYSGLTDTTHALKGVDLRIEGTGEFIAVVGHTGSGKSTLVQLMNGLLVPNSGVVNVFGFRLPAKRNQKINELRQEVGLVFQFPEYQLFEETVLKDIMFGPKNFKKTKVNAEERALEAAKLVGLDDNILKSSPFRISGGQMRRAAIAGILAMDPKVLVLDEPTRGLDPQGRREMMDLFKEIHEKTNKTIILITHDMDLVSEYAKRVIVLSDGLITFDGTKEELFEKEDFKDYHLSEPQTIKILKYLEEEIGLKFKEKYTYDSLLEYIVEGEHE
ncbi:MAG TPA: energy-coupling factor transporter ATPase [Acholeplasmataceae bacterium]|nr:energy-coupling factor transporter ATPase [Acholeplasmataceae bacterium]